MFDIKLYTSNKYLVSKLSTSEASAEVIPVADLHTGVSTFWEAGFCELVRYLRDTGAFWWGNGDLMEIAQKTSPGDSVYTQTMTPSEQRKYLIEKFKPIAGRCLGLVKGNHEERIEKATGYDPMMLLAEALGVPYLGWEFFGVVSVNVGSTHSNAFSIYSSHTYSGNKTQGLAFNWAEREIEKWIDNVDVIVKSHDHGKGIVPVEYVSIDAKQPAVNLRTRYLVLSGHFMERPGSYIAGRAGRPKPPGAVALRFSIGGHSQTRLISSTYVPSESWIEEQRSEDKTREVAFDWLEEGSGSGRSTPGDASGAGGLAGLSEDGD